MDDDDPNLVGALTWYLDYDGDGYGNPSFSELACNQPADHVSDDQDCDDLDPLSYPGATEVFMLPIMTAMEVLMMDSPATDGR